MSATVELSDFAARLRRLIRACAGGPESGAATQPAEDQSFLSPRPVFDELALELFALQFEQNAPYRRFCEARQAGPGRVTHWSAIPAVPAAAFKESDLSCLPAEERSTVFHSSGTIGQQPSRHFHHAASLAVYEASLWAWFSANCQLPIANCQLAVLTPPPAQAPYSSLVHMFDTLRRELAAGESAFVGKLAGDGAWDLDLEAALQLLRAASAGDRPVLLLGTAFSFVHLLDALAEQDLCLALPSGSCVLETGGYKNRSRLLPKATLHALISQRLGISSVRILCEYGMSELSSQAYDCALAPARLTLQASRSFHFPPWARAQVISPETGREVGEGETGLIRVFDLANVYSVMAIQTEDLGVRRAQGFELLGRAVMAEPRGCSLAAA
jgi:hypothetical protein